MKVLKGRKGEGVFGGGGKSSEGEKETVEEESEDCPNECVGSVISAKNTSIIGLFRRVMTGNRRKTEKENGKNK